jgi:hypothetical protein
MIRTCTFTIPTALVLLAIAAPPHALEAQVDPVTSAATPGHAQPVRLSGPRAGVTFFTGDVADFRQANGQNPLMSQFGWQSEKRLVATETGMQALLEWVILVGGVEDTEMNLSNSFIAGIRTPSGLEFGVGPSISIAEQGTTTSLVTAAGVTLPFGEIQLPINVAVAYAEGGPRITTLVGWMVR